MSLTYEQQTQLIDHFFDTIHPEVCKDDHNLTLIASFIKTNTRGMEHLNRAGLEWALQQVKGQLHYYQHVDLSAQLAAGAEAQKRLAEEEADKAAKAETLRKQLEREARQQARRPGPSSAFANSNDAATEKEEARKAAESAIYQQQRYRVFQQRLSEANVYWEPNHSAKADRKKQLFDAIRRDFPEFRDQVPG